MCGWAADSRVNALLLNNIALTVGGIATFISPIVFNSYYSLIFYGSIFGVSVGNEHKKNNNNIFMNFYFVSLLINQHHLLLYVL